MSAASQELLELSDLENAAPPDFYRNIEEVREQGGKQPYTHLIRKAWDAMGLNGVLCVDRVPTIYFKEVKRIDPVKMRELHQKLWNQGTAAMLVAVSDTQVCVYSSQSLPGNPKNEAEVQRGFVKTLERTADALQSFLSSVHTGCFYREHPDKFSATNGVDQYLLQNLRVLRDKLVKAEGAPDPLAIHTLLGRIIFTSYLADREIIRQDYFENAGVSDVHCLKDFLVAGNEKEAADHLRTLFDILQETFNGSMFSDIPGQDLCLSEESITILRHFFSGEELKSKQMGLDFWAYDFSIIPIELISVIYEEFLQAEDKAGKHSAGAFYTPKHLAEMVVDVAVSGWDTLLGKRFLDPACGSGIFLVVLFNRIAEEWCRRNPSKRNSTRATALIDILKHNLCGIDIKETACRITCFSLYLALLDQLEPRDIDDLKRSKKVLPNLLALMHDGWKSSQEASAIIEGSFFNTNLPLGKPFDLVIGNPPWTGRTAKLDQSAAEWCAQEVPELVQDLPKNKTELMQLAVPGRQIAHAFMWKAPGHLHENGHCCLLLPSKVFLNEHTDRFQKAWFSAYSVERVVQLADFRKIIFEKAICPAMIVRFSPTSPDDTEKTICYDTPKVGKCEPRSGVVRIRESDQKRIRLALLLQACREERAPALWKRRLWGTPRDLEFLSRLEGYHALGNQEWQCNQGFIPFRRKGDLSNPEDAGEPKSVWWRRNHRFLNANKMRRALVLVEADCDRVSDTIQGLYRSPDKNIFYPPMVLVNQGFSKFLYCDFPVLFQHAIQSITVNPCEDGSPSPLLPLLPLLAAVLDSKLATYFLFHTAANWGTERDKVLKSELMMFPFPKPEETENPRRAQEIASEISNHMTRLGRALREAAGNMLEEQRDRIVVEARYRMEPLIYEYYDIDEQERMLIEDTVAIFEPSATPATKKTNIPALQNPTLDERKRYADTLCGKLNQWASGGKWKLNADAVIDERTGMCVLTVKKAVQRTEYKESKAPHDLQKVLVRIKPLLRDGKKPLSFLRDLAVFDGDQLHMVKWMELREWTRTAALNDADEIAAAILSPRRAR